MYSSRLQFSLSILFCFLALPVIGQDKNEDPFGQVVDPPKKKEVIQDPFAIEPKKSTPKQDIDDPFKKEPFKPVNEPKKSAPNATPQQDIDPFTPVKEPAKKPPTQDQENPFGVVQDPKKADPESELEDPFKTAEPDTGSSFGTLESQTEKQTPMAENAQGSVAQDEEVELPDEKPFEEKFWEYLKSNAYENWAPAPGQDGDMYVGESPHGAFLKMYLNRTAVGNAEELPYGSIIVKENYATDQSLSAITVMYRSKAFNPNAGDWYWIKYNPDGSVATTSVETGAAKIMGRAKGCINCHSRAGGNDFTFFNDK